MSVFSSLRIGLLLSVALSLGAGCSSSGGGPSPLADTPVVPAGGGSYVQQPETATGPSDLSTASGYGLFVTTKKSTLSGNEITTERTAAEGAQATASLGDTVTFESSVSEGGTRITATGAGAISNSTDDGVAEAHHTDYQAGDGQTKVNVYDRLGNIKPEHVRFLDVTGPSNLSNGITTQSSGYAVVGAPTASASLPTGASVVYDGAFFGKVQGGGNSYTLGTSKTTVNFDQRTYSGTIENAASGAPKVDYGGTVDGSRLTGNSMSITQGGNTVAMPANAAMTGGIFGPQGQELGAVVVAPEVISGGKAYSVDGGIVAKRQ